MSGSKPSSQNPAAGENLVEAVSQAIRDVAAAVILPRFRALEKSDVEVKEGGSLVTIADKESEALLSEKLAALLPGSVVLGEESFEADPSILGYLKDSELVWIIDPVDGTHNFAHGNVNFGVIVGLARNNETQCAWLYDAVKDTMVTAGRGQGAWIEAGKGAEPTRLVVNSRDDLDDMTAQIGGHVEHRFTNNLEAAGVGLSRIRCSLHDFLRFAQGHSQMILHRETKPWDHAATVLVAQEAGGYAALEDGTPYKPSDFGETLFVATDKKAWEKLTAMIFKR